MSNETVMEEIFRLRKEKETFLYYLNMIAEMENEEARNTAKEAIYMVG